MNIQEIDKWLDNEYGVSYTKLEELHDFVVEQDLKHCEEKDKEIERLNNIINELEKYLELEEIYWCKGWSDIYEDSLGNTRLVREDIFNEITKIKNKLQELKGGEN